MPAVPVSVIGSSLASTSCAWALLRAWTRAHYQQLAAAQSWTARPCLDIADGSDFDPNFRRVASSWKRQPADVRDKHFFASLDFADGGAIYQRVRRAVLDLTERTDAQMGLQTAPTVQFHPAAAGPDKAAKLSVVTYDLNRK